MKNKIEMQIPGYVVICFKLLQLAKVEFQASTGFAGDFSTTDCISLLGVSFTTSFCWRIYLPRPPPHHSLVSVPHFLGILGVPMQRCSTSWQKASSHFQWPALPHCPECGRAVGRDGAGLSQFIVLLHCFMAPQLSFLIIFPLSPGACTICL